MSDTKTLPGGRLSTRFALRTLKALMAASLLGPALLFCYAAWETYHSQFREARGEIEREAGVLREHALKVFETAELLIAEIDTVLGRDDVQSIRRDEQALHLQLAAMIKDLPQFRDVWIIDGDGKPLASAVLYPVPRELDLSDRDYYVATRDSADTFIGEVVTGRTSYTRYFNIARRRSSASGGYNGSIAVAVLPSYFSGVYEKLIDAPTSIAGLLRADGTLLARHPSLPKVGVRLSAQSGFMRAIAREPEQGYYEARSELADTAPRIFAYRKLEKFPAYAYAASNRDAIIADWMQTMSIHLIFGVPATVCLFALTYLALRGTRHIQEEMRRREVAEAAFLQAQKMEAIVQLTGGVAHDFNNLMTVIAGSLDRIAGIVADDPKLKKLTDAALRATDRATTLTTQLLAFARRQPLRPELLNINGLLKDFRPLLRRAVGETTELQFVFDPTLWPARVDRVQFEAALLNLVVNARDALPQGGQITIETRNAAVTASEAAKIEDMTAGDYVLVAVGDTGTGIAPEHLPRIFDPFFTTKDVGKGSGLGLSQVFGFVKQSGGYVAVRSELGVGTTISIYLPKASSDPGLPGSSGRLAGPVDAGRAGQRP
jgi:two-component system NtrC family sensor kinase